MPRDSCPNCGQTVTGDEQFCPACGRDLSAVTCPECGTSLDGGEQFCPGCGTELDTLADDDAAASTCQFTFDVTTVDFTPPDPERTDREYAPHALDSDELTDGVWSCDRSVGDAAEYCLFHSPDPPADPDFASAIADRVAEADNRVSLVGTTLPEIDLSGRTVDTTLDLRHTTISGDVTLEGATVTEPVLLARARIDGDLTFSEADLSAQLECEGATVAGNVYGSDASFTQADFAGGTWDGPVNFTDTTFEEFDCSDARFGDQAFFQGMSVSNEARFAEAWFGEAHFNSAYFASGVNYRNAHFSGPVTMNDLVCDGTGTLEGATFMQEVSFSEATFSRGLELMEAKFLDDVRFDAVNGEVRTFDTEFNGSVSGDVSYGG